ncbi:uncharacterized protein LOC144076241 [Stigmatopora argus]
MYILDKDMECLPRAYSYFDDEEFCQSLLKDLQRFARSPSVKTSSVSDVPQVDKDEEAEPSWNCGFSLSDDDDDDASLSYSSSSEDDMEEDTGDDAEDDVEEDVEDNVEDNVEGGEEDDAKDDAEGGEEDNVEGGEKNDVEGGEDGSKDGAEDGGEDGVSGVPTSEEKMVPLDEDVEPSEDFREPVENQETDDYTSDYCSTGGGTSSESEEEIDVVTVGQRPLQPTSLLSEIQQQHNYAAPPPASPPKRPHVHQARASTAHAYVESQDRRWTHTALERKRRSMMRIFFWRLRDAIPELRGNNRAPKILILSRARDLIRDLEASAYRLGTMRYALRARRKEMKEQLSYLTGAPDS